MIDMGSGNSNYVPRYKGEEKNITFMRKYVSMTFEIEYGLPLEKQLDRYMHNIHSNLRQKGKFVDRNLGFYLYLGSGVLKIQNF